MLLKPSGGEYFWHSSEESNVIAVIRSAVYQLHGLDLGILGEAIILAFVTSRTE